MNDEDDGDWYDDPDGSDLPEPYKTIDDLLWGAFDSAWETIETRAAIRDAQLAVPLQADGSAMEGMGDVVRFDTYGLGNTTMLACSTAAGTCFTVGADATGPRVELQQAPDPNAAAILSVDVSPMPGCDDISYVVTTVSSTGTVTLNVAMRPGSRPASAVAESAGRGGVDFDTLNLTQILLEPEAEPADPKSPGGASPTIEDEEVPPRPIAARLVEGGGAAYLVVSAEREVSIYHVDKPLLEQTCRKGSEDRPLRLHAKVQVPATAIPAALPAKAVEAVRFTTKHPDRKIDKDAAFQQPLVSFHDVPLECRLCVAWRGHNQVLSVGASALPGGNEDRRVGAWSHGGPIEAIAGNGAAYLAVGLASGLVAIWDVANAIQTVICDVCPSPVACLGFNGTGTKLLAAGGAGLPYLVDCARGTAGTTVPLDRVPTVAGSLAPSDSAFDGAAAIYASDELMIVAPVRSRGSFYVIDPATGAPAGLVRSAVPLDVDPAAGTAALVGDRLYVRAKAGGADESKLYQLPVVVPEAASSSEAAAEVLDLSPQARCGYMSVGEALAFLDAA